MESTGFKEPQIQRCRHKYATVRVQLTIPGSCGSAQRARGIYRRLRHAVFYPVESTGTRGIIHGHNGLYRGVYRPSGTLIRWNRPADQIAY